MSNAWHTKTKKEVLSRLFSAENGLSRKSAKRRLRESGPNVIPEGERDSYGKMFLRQFRSPLIYILFFATLAILFLGKITDGIIIFLIMLFNSVVGAIQEGKAQNTLLTLRKSIETESLVLRDAKKVVVRDKELVAGDVIILHEGDKVPADARLLETNRLLVDESALTGESQAVLKEAGILRKANLPVQEHKNMVFRGTHIVGGTGTAILVATGLETEIGKISSKIFHLDTEIPLQKDVRNLSRLIILFVGIIAFGLILFGLAKGQSWQALFSTAVALSISIVPEGLPVVLTLVLARGVWRMSRRNALIKRLQAVEALGQAEFFAVDKTGTITENELVVTSVFADGKAFRVLGAGYAPEGAILDGERKTLPEEHSALGNLARDIALVSGAQVYFNEEEKTWKAQGDPTEAALTVFSEKAGMKKPGLEKQWKILQNIPFDYQKKYHAVLFGGKEKNLLSVVGAPENILRICRKYRRNGKMEPMTERTKKELHKIFSGMSRRGLRVLAVAEKDGFSGKIAEKKLPDLAFLGFVGMKDSLKAGVREVMEKAIKSGMKISMVTGDYKETAVSIAKEAGIFKRNSKVLTGEELDGMSDKELERKIFGVSVFARLTPAHKLRIIQAYRNRKKIVAMTGDGVNDALPLVAADLGIGMGKKGTEVAKEAADIVLLDDNFSSITAAVEEGRAIFQTVKRVILYLLSTGIGEVLAIFGAMFFGFPTLLLPSQIIWLNFITDGFLDLALAMEPRNPAIGTGGFKRPGRYIIDKSMAARMILMAVTMAAGTLFLFFHYLDSGTEKAMTVALTTLAVFQWFNAWNCRSEKKSVFKMNPFSNKFLVAATILVVGLQILAVYTPFFQKVLHTEPISIFDWFVILSIGVSILVTEEIRKIFHSMPQKTPRRKAG